MIISHKYKFIFIKNLKTAGTSIEAYLCQYCGERDIITLRDPHVARNPRNHRGFWNPLPELLTLRRSPRRVFRELFQRNKFWHHIPAQLVRARIPAGIWNSYFKFCVERNPWDKTISHFSMVKSWAGGNLSLTEYFARGDFPTNFERYTDAAGAPIVDKILKYENLNEELDAIFSSLGVPFSGGLTVKEKGEYRTDRRPYSEFLSPEQGQKIACDFADEIAMHGYVFGDDT